MKHHEPMHYQDTSHPWGAQSRLTWCGREVVATKATPVIRAVRCEVCIKLAGFK